MRIAIIALAFLSFDLYGEISIQPITSECIDSLVMSENVLWAFGRSPSIEKWKTKVDALIKARNKDILAFNKSRFKREVFIQHCAKGSDALLARLKKKDPSVTKGIEPKIVDEQFAAVMTWLEFAKKNEFQALWELDFAPAARQRAEAVKSWPMSKEGKARLKLLKPLICAAKKPCLENIRAWVSGLPTSVRLGPDKGFILGDGSPEDLNATMTFLISGRYQTEVKWPHTMTATQASIHLPQLASFLATYSSRSSFDDVLPKAIFHFVRYALKEESHRYALRSFVAPGPFFSYVNFDPLGAQLYLHLRARFDVGKTNTHADIEKFLVDWEAGGWNIKLDEFKKMVEPYSGMLGIERAKHDDGFKVRDPTFKNEWLKWEDVVTAIDGKPLKGLSEMQVTEMLIGAPGEIKKLSVLRSGKKLELNVPLRHIEQIVRDTR